MSMRCRACVTCQAHPQLYGFSTGSIWTCTRVDVAHDAVVVNRALRAFMDARRGVVLREMALAQVERSVIDQALRSGRLRRVYPCVYLDRRFQDEPSAWERAARAYAGT